MNNREISGDAMQKNGAQALKERYRIPVAWRDLGFEGQAGKSCCSPFREDRCPSFSVYEDGKRWKDHATDEGGDVVDFVARALGGSVPEAFKWIRHRLGWEPIESRSLSASAPTNRKAMPELRNGSAAELQRLATLRGFSLSALRLAQERGFLRFAQFANREAWAITDREARLVELRRLDGDKWGAYKSLPERKAHCIGQAGTKRFPIGLCEAEMYGAFLLVEGAPDLLAAFHFLAAQEAETRCGVLAMLGGAAHLAPEAAERLAGKRVRLIPHLDEAGRKGARHPAAFLDKRALDYLQRYGQPPGFADGGLGAVLRVEADRAGGRAPAGFAGGDAAGRVRPGAVAGHG